MTRVTPCPDPAPGADSGRQAPGRLHALNGGVRWGGDSRGDKTLRDTLNPVPASLRDCLAPVNQSIDHGPSPRSLGPQGHGLENQQKMTLNDVSPWVTESGLRISMPSVGPKLGPGSQALGSPTPDSRGGRLLPVRVAPFDFSFLCVGPEIGFFESWWL